MGLVSSSCSWSRSYTRVDKQRRIKTHFRYHNQAPGFKKVAVIKHLFCICPKSTLTSGPNTLLAASADAQREGSRKFHGSGFPGMGSCPVWQSPTWSPQTPTACHKTDVSFIPKKEQCFSCIGTHHVTLYSKNSVSQTLHCDPFHWHFGNPALPVIIPTVDLFRQSKVCNAHRHIITEPVPEKLCQTNPSSFWGKNHVNAFKPHMQLRAARSRCRKWRPLRYSMPNAMSIMNFRSVCVGKN